LLLLNHAGVNVIVLVSERNVFEKQAVSTDSFVTSAAVEFYMRFFVAEIAINI
jgi:hypothetical protein